MNRKILFPILVMALAAVLFLAYALFLFESGGRKVVKAAPPAELRLAVYRGDTSLIPYIAREMGYFDSRGLRVEFIEYEAGKLAVDAMLSGSADISTSTEAVFVSNSFQHPDLRVFSIISECHTNGLIGRKDRGIESGEDLAGKRIGLTGMSSGEYNLGVLLTFNGLSFDDVEIVEMNPSKIVDAVSSGNIDAGFTWEPNIYEAEKLLGENALVIKRNIPEVYFILMGRAGWLENNHDSAARFVEALLEAEKYIRDNPEAAAAFMATEFGLDKDYLDATWENHNFVVGLPQALVISMEDQARWAVRNGLFGAKEVPNYLNFIDTGFLDSLEPNAVGILR